MTRADLELWFWAIVVGLVWLVLLVNWFGLN